MIEIKDNINTFSIEQLEIIRQRHRDTQGVYPIPTDLNVKIVNSTEDNGHGKLMVQMTFGESPVDERTADVMFYLEPNAAFKDVLHTYALKKMRSDIQILNTEDFDKVAELIKSFL